MYSHIFTVCMYVYWMDSSMMSEQSVGGDEVLQSCSTTFKVTLFRSRKSNYVPFLEAGKGFEDTFFSFLILPLGTILHILSQGKDFFLAVLVTWRFGEKIQELECLMWSLLIKFRILIVFMMRHSINRSVGRFAL